MNGNPPSWRHLARVTIEFTAPFRVGSGATSHVADLLPVRDANGLPALPGTSIAGVLAHAYRRANGEGAWRSLFGRGGDDARGSRLWVSWGHVHDRSDTPVEGLLLGGVRDDPVLEDALVPTVRDHVRIGHRGGPERHGKFEEAVVSAGHRFTFDLAIEAGADGRDELAALLDILRSGGVRLGAGTRRGLGAFRVVRALWGSFDLGTEGGARAYASVPVRLAEPAPALAERRAPPGGGSMERVLRVTVEPEGFWAVHGSEAWTLDGEDKPPDLNPVRDGRVVWGCDGGRVERDRFYLPGSSVKGALAHRTAFYANLLAGRFADRVEGGPEACAGARNPEVCYLFGAAKGEGGDEDRAGRVFVDDVWLDHRVGSRLQRVPHIAVNRFTGGVLDGFLMEERVFYRTGPLTLTLRFDHLPETNDGVRERALEALRRALGDLLDGQLPLGAGASRGNGAFRAAEGYDLDAAWEEAFGGREVAA